MSRGSPNLLIVVHPGSLCGSADMHLGAFAESFRLAIAREVDGWDGPVAIIDGELSDELERREYAHLRTTLERADFHTPGLLGEASILTEAANHIASHYQLKPGDPITVTGAWRDANGKGCVPYVADALKRAGFKATISPNAPASDIAPRMQELRRRWDTGQDLYQLAAEMEMSPQSATSLISRIRRDYGLGLTARERRPMRNTLTQPQLVTYIRVPALNTVPPPAKDAPMVAPDVKLPKGTQLHARYLQHQFTATILEDGRSMTVDGLGTFPSPSAAAIAAARSVGHQRSINGQDFWRATLVNGEECRLSLFRFRPELSGEIAKRRIPTPTEQPPPPSESKGLHR